MSKEGYKSLNRTEDDLSKKAKTRSAWAVTRSVWFAMFMREAIGRTMTDRMGWFWMIAEPMAFILIMVAIRGFLSSDRLIVNAPFIPWMVVGMLGFFLVRDGLTKGAGAISSNRALFAYRQVQPVDGVIVRNLLDALIRTIVFLLFILGALLLGTDLSPDNGFQAIFGWLSLWMLGVGFSLLFSVIVNMVSEVGKIITMASMPLLIISGVMIPLNSLPHFLLKYLMLNPIVHGLEYMRHGFFENYQVVHGTSMLYFWSWTLGMLALGLIMQVRLKERLKAQ